MRKDKYWVNGIDNLHLDQYNEQRGFTTKAAAVKWGKRFTWYKVRRCKDRQIVASNF